jgi:hypothetical protein
MNQQDAQRIISSLDKISEPGKKIMKVTSNPTYYEGREHEPARYLLNLKATTPDKMEKARSLGKEGDYQGAVNVATLSFGQTVGYNGDIPWLPSKGETINAEVEEVEDSEGNSVLRITSISPREAEKSSRVGEFSFDDEGEEEAEEATQGEKFDEEEASS